MLRSADNIAIRNGVLAVARAHARLPGFDQTKATELARRIDTLVHDEQQMHVTVALAILLLKAMGVLDAADASRFARG